MNKISGYDIGIRYRIRYRIYIIRYLQLNITISCTISYRADFYLHWTEPEWIVLPPIHSELNLWKILTQLEIWMSLEGVMFSSPGPFFSLLAPFVPLVIWAIHAHTRPFLWSSSVPLNPSV